VTTCSPHLPVAIWQRTISVRGFPASSGKEPASRSTLTCSAIWRRSSYWRTPRAVTASHRTSWVIRARRPRGTLRRHRNRRVAASLRAHCAAQAGKKIAMTSRHAPERHYLAFTEWPAQDQTIWAKLTEPGPTVLDDRGAFADSRPRTNATGSIIATGSTTSR
jgi:hypothetical protein